MRVIYKYQLVVGKVNTLDMPFGAKILSIQMQHGDICIWAEVNPEVDLTVRRFTIYGTGSPLASNAHKYLATVIDGAFVWHVYEEL